MAQGKAAFALLQKTGKSLMLPVSVLPVAGILLGVGSAHFTWLPPVVSDVMAQSGGAIFGNLALIFAIGVALGVTGNDGVAALAAVVGYAVLLATMTAKPTTAASEATPSLPVRPRATPMAKMSGRLPKTAPPACAITFATLGAISFANAALPTPSRMPATGSTETGSMRDLPIFCSQPNAVRQALISGLRVTR